MLATRPRPAVPPPVPPRPSKSLVAAALARTRAVGLVPTRRAPPPPVADVENLPPKPCELKRTPSHFADRKERLALRDNVNNDAKVESPEPSPETHKLSVQVTSPPRRPPYVLPTGQHRHSDRLVHELVRELKETSEQRAASCCRMAAAGSSSALQGLPPLPKSLSGANLVLPEAVYGRQLPVVPPSRGAGGRQQPQQRGPHRKTPTGLDAQLAVLRNEMFGLRQLDLSLLSQLWSLNESIQEFRQLLQEQDDRSPPSPSSAEEGEEFYSPLPPSRYPPLKSVPEQYRLSSSSSGSSIEYGDV